MTKATSPQENGFDWNKLKSLSIVAKNEVWADLRAARWKRGGLWTCFTIWVLSLVAFLATFYTIYVYSFFDSTCTGEAFNVETKDLWSIAEFFEISMASGTLTFTAAKAIDVAWDIVIGRGGQTILAMFTWKAMSTHVQYSMLKGPVTYDTFWTVFMEDRASVISTVRLSRDFLTKQAIRSKRAMIFTIMSLAFILAFPTLSSSMTGYISRTEPFIRDIEGRPVPESDFRPVVYMIHDGPRVDLPSDHMIVCENSYPWSQPLKVRLRWCDYWLKNTLGANVSDYVEQHGFFGLSQGETDWWSSEKAAYIKIPSPALNISAFYLDGESRPFGHSWVDPRTQLRPFNEFSNALFALEGSTATYSTTYILDHGTCIVSSGYQWGFSFLQSFIFLLLLLVYSMGTWTLWLNAHLRLQNLKYHDTPRRFKAALLLSQQLSQDLRPVPPLVLESLTTKEIDNQVSEQLNGGRIHNSQVIHFEEEATLRSRVLDWFRREKWWVAALAFVLSFPGWVFMDIFLEAAGFVTAAAITLLPALLVGIILALSVGTTPKSRGMMVGFFAVLGAGPWIYLSIL
ncbi:hypothetical protein QBC40DRAFT_288297 [Triangularia verruculosa]|uniref:Uncharacterized protein n=1 Tax=Triangularia verruculosa TaxID=2587418 RepID=A0AAN6X8X3_9PEZI|nr:hypothetical protein QBC40DRAFT_288297 [Triangularia verruculosa]